MQIYTIKHGIQGDFLAGTVAGLTLLEKIKPLVGQGSCDLLILDFDQIEIATGSCLRELVTGIRRYCIEFSPDTHVIVTNLSVEVEKELSFVLGLTDDAILGFDRTGKKGKANRVRVIGRLDQKLSRTLNAVDEFEEVDATTLAKKFSKAEGIGPTGWNNRLVILKKMGLVRELKVGKGKRYRAVAKEVVNGN